MLSDHYMQFCWCTFAEVSEPFQIAEKIALLNLFGKAVCGKVAIPTDKLNLLK